MKILALLFLIGCASASFYDALDNAADEVVRDFMSGMEKAPPLRQYLDMDHDEIDQIEDDIKTELGKKLKEMMDSLMEKLKEAVDHGKEIKEETLKKIAEVASKLKEMKLDIGEKARDMWDKLKDKLKGKVDTLIEAIKDLFKREKRATDEAEAALEELDVKKIWEKLKEMIKEKVNVEALKEKLKELVKNKASELLQRLLDLLEKNEMGKIKDLLERITGKEEELSTRSVKSIFEKIKEYFEKLKIDVQEKHAKFLEWAKDALKNGIDKTKSGLENVKAMAKEFIGKMNQLKQEVAEQGLQFFHEYQDALLGIYDDMKEKMKEIFQKEG